MTSGSTDVADKPAISLAMEPYAILTLPVVFSLFLLYILVEDYLCFSKDIQSGIVYIRIYSCYSR